MEQPLSGASQASGTSPHNPNSSLPTLIGAVFEACPSALVVLTPQGEIRYWNSASQALTGIEAGVFQKGRIEAILPSVPLAGTDQEVPYAWPDGSSHLVRWVFSAFHAPSGEEFILATGSPVSPSEAAGLPTERPDAAQAILPEGAEEGNHPVKNRARILSQLSQSLADISLDYQAVLDTTVAQVAGWIGDLAAIQVLSDDRAEIVTVAAHHTDPDQNARARKMLVDARHPSSLGLSAQVISSGLPVLIQNMPPDRLAEVANPAWLPYLSGKGKVNLLIVPLRAHGETFGMLALSRQSKRRPYTVDDLNFVLEIADRAALAIENARLYNDNLRQRENLELNVAKRTAEVNVINQYLQLQLSERKRAEEELSLFFDVSLDMLCIFSFDGFFTRLSPTWSKTLGWTDEELCAQPYVFFVQPDDRPNCERILSLLADNKAVADFEYRMQCKDGSYRWLSSNMVGLPERGIIIAAARDITERKQAEQRLAEALEINQKIIANAPVGIFTYRANGECILANESGARTAGCSLLEIASIPFHQMAPWQRTELLDLAGKVLANGEEKRGELHLLSPQGHESWLEYYLARFQSSNEPRLLLMTNDITSRKKVEDELQYLATHDALTGLPNRHLFQDRLDLALARAHRSKQQVAVMLLDLDHFKQINDTYGHQTGDLLLQRISERLSGCLRRSDTVTRMGGDEFTFIFPDIFDTGHIEVIAQKILAAIHQPVDLNGIRYQSTGSLGISLYPANGTDAETLLKNADIAMYQAKKVRNSFCLSSNAELPTQEAAVIA